MDIITGKQPGAVKVVVYGVEGVGKSTLAAQFPEALFIDTEGSTRYMDVARLEFAPKTWAMLMEQVKWFKDTKPARYQTLVIDTADWAEQLAIEHVLNSHKISGNPASGIEDYGYSKGYTYLAEEYAKLLNLLSDVVESGRNVVLTAHAQIKAFTLPEESGSYDRWELKMSKKTSALTKEWADLLLFANFETIVIKDDGKAKGRGGSTRVMYAEHSATWDAKNRHGLPAKMPFDYSSIASVVTGAALTPVVAKPAEPLVVPAVVVEAPEVVIDIDEPVPFDPPPSELAPLPKHLAELKQLLDAAGLNFDVFCRACEMKGFAPAGMPIENYSEDLVRGIATTAWSPFIAFVADHATEFGVKVKK